MVSEIQPVGIDIIVLLEDSDTPMCWMGKLCQGERVFVCPMCYSLGVVPFQIG